MFVKNIISFIKGTTEREKSLSGQNDLLKKQKSFLLKFIMKIDDDFDNFDSYRKISYIRDFVMQNFPHSSNDLGHPDSDPIVRFLDGIKNRSGALCGGTSQVLLELYTALGFKAVVKSFGIKDSPITHTLCLVYDVDSDGIVVMDPMYGQEFMEEGRPIGIRQLLEAAHHDQWGRFRSSSVELPGTRTYLVKRDGKVVKEKEKFPEWTNGAFTLFKKSISSEMSLPDSDYAYLTLPTQAAYGDSELVEIIEDLYQEFGLSE